MRRSTRLCRETELFVFTFADLRGRVTGNARVVTPATLALGVPLLFAVIGFSACAPPPAAGLPGTPLAPVALPRTELAPGHRLLTFRWEYVEGNSLTRGDGSLRVAPPDSARLDLFLGAFGSGAALLISDRLHAPLPESARKLIPPPTMLWAAIGRLAVPAATDTVVTADHDLIRGDIGHDPVWRVTFSDGTLIRLEHINGGRVLEHVERAGTRIRYVSNVAPRRLTLNITSDEPAPPFDRSIWAL